MTMPDIGSHWYRRSAPSRSREFLEAPYHWLGRFVWYNSINGVVTTSWFAFAWIGTGEFGFCLLSILSIPPGIRLDRVENMETGEGMDSRKRQ
jgi:hypothetical protein